MKQKKKIKSSFLYRFLIYFIFLIIIPIFCAWWIYEKLMDFYYADNSLRTQQVNMENSCVILDVSLNNIRNTLMAIRSNQEIMYYLEYYPSKSYMMYGTFKSVNSFCEELQRMTPYIEDIKIYCDSPLPIYAGVFVELKNIKQENDLKKELESAGIDGVVWQIVESENTDFPYIHAYMKLFDDSFMKLVGVVEIQISPMLLEDYSKMVKSLSLNEHAIMTLYHKDMPIYSTSTEEDKLVSYEEIVSTSERSYIKNEYTAYLKISELNLCFTFSGHLLDLNIQPVRNIPSIFFTLVLILLLAVFIIFFMNIITLSRRILAFSSFIQSSDPENLLPFHPKERAGLKEDEMNLLVDTYNVLIQEKNSLISKVQKMELFTQDARFQALQEQIHPHFIYGTLETIRMTALQNKDTEAASMIFSLSTLLRYSMAISTKAVTLKEELEIARHYLEIQKMRFDNRIEYIFHVEEKLLDMEMPSFVLQPILENAIVYGVSQTLEPCTLTVEACEEDNCIILSISNTGLPITKQRLQEVNELLCGVSQMESFKGKCNGLALNNIKERIAIFYSGRASIQLALHEGRTATVITIEKD